MKYRRIMALVMGLLAVLCLGGCSGINRDTKIVLTTGFTKDEVFRIETASCYKKEVMVYLTNLQNQYEQVYGTEIWQREQDGVTIEESVKESVLAELAQIKTMNLMAENYGLSLDESEAEAVDEAARIYFDSLTETEKEQLDVTLDTVRQLYREYAMADKVYDYMIQDVNPEISDDEARTVTLQQILVRTGTKDRSGNIEPYSDQQKSYAYATAVEALRRIEAGEDFDVVATRYNEASESTVFIRKGEAAAAYEEAAFELGNDEVSDVVETEEGYYILKCISTLNREETDMNKIRIVDERRKEAFSKEYDSYVQTLTRHMNGGLWEEITLLHDSEITTSSFFEVFTEYYKR